MKKIFYNFLLTSSLSVQAASLQVDPVVVTSKQNLKTSDIQSDHFVLTSDQLDQIGITTVGQVLATIPGLELSQTGALGGESTIFIRGLGSGYTLILVNGVKVFDPTTTNRSFNLSVLNSLNIERVEVLKGNQSVLYGSDAIGGVVNIITRKGQEQKSYAKVGLGNYELLSVSQNINFESSILQVGSYYQQAIGENDVEDGSEKDKKIIKGYDLSYLWSRGKWSLDSIIKKTNSYFDVDQYDYSLSQTKDDDQMYNETIHDLYHQKIQYDISGLNHLTFDLSHQEFFRWNKYLSNSKYSTARYMGHIQSLEVRYDERWKNSNFVTGMNMSAERFKSSSESDQYLSTLELFYNHKIDFKTLHFEFGTRTISNKDFGDHGIGAISIKKILTSEFYVRSSYKTGFKSPSLYQQKAESGGNENLTPEKSETLELGFGKNSEIWSYGSTFFYTHINNQIDYTDKYVNIDKTISRGVELSSLYKWSTVNLNSSLTLLNLAEIDGKEQVRRPDLSMTQALDWSFSSSDAVGVRWRYIGRRFDNKGLSEQVEMNAYSLADLSYRHFIGNGKISIQLNNLFDQQYEHARGYRTLGTNLQVDFVYNY